MEISHQLSPRFLLNTFAICSAHSSNFWAQGESEGGVEVAEAEEAD